MIKLSRRSEFGPIQLDEYVCPGYYSRKVLQNVIWHDGVCVKINKWECSVSDSPHLGVEAKLTSRDGERKEDFVLRVVFDSFLKFNNIEEATEFYDWLENAVIEGNKKRSEIDVSQYVISKELADTKNRIDNFFKSEDLYKQYGQKYRRGILLYGPPGTGKSQFAKYISTIYPNIPVIYHIDDGYENESKNRNYKRHKNVIIIQDELEKYMNCNSLGDCSSKDRAELLEALEDIREGAVLIATTNKPESFDVAFFNRPGRFDDVIYIGEPTKDCIKKFLELKNAADLIDVANGMTYAQLNELICRVYISGEDKKTASNKIKENKKAGSLDAHEKKEEVGFRSGGACGGDISLRDLIADRDDSLEGLDYRVKPRKIGF